MTCLFRRTFDPTTLFATTPPRWRVDNKQLVYDLACPPGSVHGGPLELTRWRAIELPARLAIAAIDVVVVPSFFDYASTTPASWHVNFADPALFYAYGSHLLAQDELQVIEHPVLGALRETLLAESIAAVTKDGGAPTPVLVRGVERRCELETAPCESRPAGLYGNRFASAAAADVGAAVRVCTPPTVTNLIAIAAPVGAGRYTVGQLAEVLITAMTGFGAARRESAERWPGAPVEVCTGFWGCGAFGGNRRVMTMLQLLAARASGVDRVRYYVGTAADVAIFEAAAADLAGVLAAGHDATAAILARIEALGFAWGTSDGN